MSSNQKQVPSAVPQQSQQTQQQQQQQPPPQRYSQGPFNKRPPTPQRADGGYHITPPPQSFGPQQGPSQPQNQVFSYVGPSMRPMAPTGPPNQSSTPPQTEVKMPMQPPGSVQMYVSSVPSQVRGNQQFLRPPLQAFQRNSTHRQAPIYQPPIVYGTPIAQPLALISGQLPQYQYNQPRPSASYFQQYPMPHSQPIYGSFSNQSAPTSYFFPPQPGAGPMNIVQRAGPPSVGAPTGQQGPAQPQPPTLPTLSQPIQPQPATQQKRRRLFALAIVDPATGYDKSEEIYEGKKSSPQESDEASNARDMSHADSAVAEFTKLVTQRAQEDSNVIRNSSGEIVSDSHNTMASVNTTGMTAATGASSDITQTDGTVHMKLGKKIESIPASESKLQAASKDFVPDSAPKVVPMRETPVVSASDGIEVNLYEKSSKERESPAKSRKPRDNVQRSSETARGGGGSEHHTNVVMAPPMQQQQTPVVATAPAAASVQIMGGRESELPLATQQRVDPVLPTTQQSTHQTQDIKNISQEIIQACQQQQQQPAQVTPSREINAGQENYLVQEQTVQVASGAAAKEVYNSLPVKEPSAATVAAPPPSHHVDVASSTSTKTKSNAKTKSPDQHQKFAAPANNDNAKLSATSTNETLSSSTSPSTDNIQAKSKNTASDASKKPIKDNKAQFVTNTNTTTSAIKQSQSVTTTAAPSPTPVPVAATVPVTQPPKPGNKSNKRNELNRKGADKEGTDMDAFNNEQQQTIVIHPQNQNINDNNNTVTSSSTSSVISIPSSTTVSSMSTSSHTSNITSGDNNNKEEIIDNKKDEVITSLSASTDDGTTPKHEVKQQQKVDVCNVFKNAPPKQVPAKSVTATAKNVDNKSTALSDTEKLVQAKNEANAKASAAAASTNSVADATPSVAKEAPGDAKPAVNYTYKPGQWSPSNPEGEKVYERDFLVALQNDPKSKQRPVQLPLDLDVVIRDFNKSRLAESKFPSLNRTHDTLMPNYVKTTSSQRLSTTKHSSIQGSKTKSGSSSKLIHLSLREDVKLHKAENAWRPAHMKEKQMTVEEAKTEELLKKVRGVLNKLTPQKFDTLIGQIKTFPIESEKQLKDVIDLVFKKAVDEPSFSVEYAKLCKSLSALDVPSATGESSANFRRLLLQQCQTQFEEGSKTDDGRNNKPEENKKDTDSNKIETELDEEEEERRKRNKSVGNIRFVGELYKLDMLTGRVMMQCTDSLLSQLNEENLECLCKLLITVGKKYETRQPDDVRKVFNSIQNIVDTKRNQISSRVRFMLLDVIELRNNKWVPRRQDMKPKTMDEIQKEAVTEQLNMQIITNTPRKDERNSSMSGDRNKRGGRNNVTEEGWSPAPSRGSRPPNNYSVETSKLKSNKPTAVTEMQLGSRTVFTNWGRGSNIKNTPSMPITSTNNMFSALEHVSTEPNRIRQPPLGTRNGNQEPYSSKGSSMERSYKSFDGGSSSRSGSQDGSQQVRHQVVTTPSISSSHSSVSSQPSQPEELDPVKLAKKIKSVMYDYLSDGRSKEFTVQDIRTTIPVSALPLFVKNSYLLVFQKSSTARVNFGKLLVELIKQDVLPKNLFLQGLQAVFENIYIETLLEEFPKIYDYLAEINVSLLAEGVIDLRALSDVSSILIENGDCGKMYATLFNKCATEMGFNFVRGLWNDSRLQVCDFIPKADEAKFIKDNHLEYLFGNSNTSSVLISGHEYTFDEICARLLEFFEKKTSFDQIVDWIGTNIGKKVTSNEFIRALMTAICEHSVVKQKLQLENFKSHYQLLQRYVDHKEEREMQCLFALLAFSYKLKFPQGMLFKMAHALWDDNILASESFIAWEQNKDPAEQEGKGVALKSLTSLFTALKESINDSGDEADGADSLSTSVNSSV